MESNERQFLKVILNPKYEGTLTTKEYLYLYGYITYEQLDSEEEFTEVSQLKDSSSFQADFLAKGDREEKLRQYKLDKKSNDFLKMFGL